MIISKAMRLLSSVRKPRSLVLLLTTILLAAQTYGQHQNINEVKAPESIASAEDTRHPLDARTRCIALFRECLILIEQQDKKLFANLGDGASGQTFKISLSKPSFEDQKEADRFWGRNFRFDASVARTKFKEIHFAQTVKSQNSVTVKNSETGETIDGKLHTIKIKLPSAVVKSAKKEDMVEAELRVLEVKERLYWVPFGW
jgi:hypothetical protein